MTNGAGKKHNLVLSFCACFCAIEAGAIVVCVGLMLKEAGLEGFFEGLGLWVMGQGVILPLALVLMPLGALIRTVLSLTFENARHVALRAGTAFGMFAAFLVGIASLGEPTRDVMFVLFVTFLGGIAGLIGGWVWWRVEKPMLEGNRR